MGEPIVLTHPIRPCRLATREELSAMSTDTSWIPFMQWEEEARRRRVLREEASEQKLMRRMRWHHRFMTLSNLYAKWRWYIRYSFGWR